MALIMPKSVFLHAPKTGGEWVREAIAAAGVPTRESNRGRGWVEREHSHLGNTTGLGGWNLGFRLRPQTWRRPHGGFIFAFVRNPLDWYRSYWVYKNERDVWDPELRLDAECRSDDFGEFVARAVDKAPGHVSTMFEHYVGREETGVVSFVGRQENLVEDLVRALGMAGEKFDEATLRATAPKNVYSSDERWKGRCEYTDELKAAVIDSERRIMERFGYL